MDYYCSCLKGAVMETVHAHKLLSEPLLPLRGQNDDDDDDDVLAKLQLSLQRRC